MVQLHIKAVIFDCDGTLVDSEHCHHLSWQYALSKWNIPLEEVDYYPFVGKNGKAISKQFCEQFQLDSYDTLLKDKNHVYDEFLKQRNVPSIERTLRFVHSLINKKKELGIKLAVASAAPKEELLINLDFLKITEAFDAIVSGKDDLKDYKDPEGVNKPKPYVYLHTAKLLGLKPEECIVFEDSASGVSAASSAGMFTVAVPNRFTKQHDFSRAHLIVPEDQEIHLDKILKEKANSQF